MVRRRDYVAIGLAGVGAGSIAQFAHIPCLRRIPEARIVAVASRSGADIGLPVVRYDDPGRREGSRSAAQGDGGLPVVRYDDPFRMIEAEGLDLVYIMTPTATHLPIASAAFARGMHVMCEKPPAMNVEDSQAIVDGARAAGAKLLFGFNRRFAPNYARLKELSAEHGCDTLVLWKARQRTDPVTPESMAAANRRWEERAAVIGTPIFEFMPHMFDLALWINGPVKSFNFSSRPLYGSRVNLSAGGTMEHANGALSVLMYEEMAGAAFERVTAFGPGFTAEVSGTQYGNPDRLVIHDCGRETVVAGPADRMECGGFAPLSRHMVECVLEDRPVCGDPASAVEAIRLALAFDPQRDGGG